MQHSLSGLYLNTVAGGRNKTINIWILNLLNQGITLGSDWGGRCVNKFTSSHLLMNIMHNEDVHYKGARHVADIIVFVKASNVFIQTKNDG